MTAEQHKLILNEVLENKNALNLIHSPKVKAYLLRKVIADIKTRQRIEAYL